MLISVAADAGRDDQVDHSGHLLPLGLLVLLVLLLELLDQLTDQCANILIKEAGELAHKLHAMAPSRLSVALFEVILDVDLWLKLIVFQVLLCDRDVRQDEHLEQALQVLLNEVSIVWQGRTFSQVPHNCED